MVLRRLAYPNRLSDLQHIFGRGIADLSHIFNTTLSYIYDQYSHLVTCMNNKWWLEKEYLEVYSKAIAEKGCSISTCFGLIDGN